MRFLWLSGLLPLCGCVAAAVPLMIASTAVPLGYVGYNFYEFENVDDVKYQIESLNPPGADALSIIRRADTLAVFPSNTAADGRVIDVYRERSGFEVISSRKTINYIERNNISVDRILAFPREDREDELEKFARAVGADIVVFGRLSGVEADANVLLPGTTSMIVKLRFQVFNGDTGSLLLTENHQMIFDIGDIANDDEIVEIAALGTSDRIYEFKTGIKRASK